MTHTFGSHWELDTCVNTECHPGAQRLVCYDSENVPDTSVSLAQLLCLHSAAYRGLASETLMRAARHFIERFIINATFVAFTH